MPVMSRERSAKVKALSRNEDFRRAIGLNPEQASWEKAYRLLKRLLALRATDPFNCRAVLFYRAKTALSVSPRSWKKGSPVVPAELCRCATMLPIPTHPDQCYWDMSREPRRRFRLNFLVSRFRVDGDCELWCDPYNDVEWAERVIQRDAVKQPISDHPYFATQSYDPYGSRSAATAPEPTIEAPIQGRFTLASNELHVSLLIDGVPVYRFDPTDVQDMQTFAQDKGLAKPGSIVQPGQPLVRLVSPVSEYARIQWKDHRRAVPDMDIAKGDFLSGTRERPLVAMAARMMHQLALFARGECEDYTVFNSWAPRHLLEWAPSDLDRQISMTSVSQWRGMEDEIVGALGPQPKEVAKSDYFCVRADFEGEAPFSRIEELEGYNIAHFGEHEVILPKAAVLWDTVQEGQLFRENDPIADFAVRTHYTWEDIVKLPQVSYILRELAQALTVYPGEYGYQGSSVLFPSDITPNAWRRNGGGADDSEGVLGHYLDFRRSEQYLKGNVISGPPWSQKWTAHWQRRIHDIGYNIEPVKTLDGRDQFMPTPLCFA